MKESQQKLPLFKISRGSCLYVSYEVMSASKDDEIVGKVIRPLRRYLGSRSPGLIQVIDNVEMLGNYINGTQISEFRDGFYFAMLCGLQEARPMELRRNKLKDKEVFNKDVWMFLETPAPEIDERVARMSLERVKNLETTDNIKDWLENLGAYSLVDIVQVNRSMCLYNRGYFQGVAFAFECFRQVAEEKHLRMIDEHFNAGPLMEVKNVFSLS